jgi:hypothetical protein
MYCSNRMPGRRAMIEPLSGCIELSGCMECANLGENIAIQACIDFSEERNLAD